MTETPETPEDHPGVDKPTRDDVRRRLREKFPGWEGSEDRPMSLERFEELASLSNEERAELLAPEELAEFDELKEITGRAGARLASLYGKSVLPSFDNSAIARAIGQSSMFKGLNAGSGMASLINQGSASKFLGAASVTDGLLTSFLPKMDFASAGGALNVRYPAITGPAIEGLTRSILANSGWSDVSKLISTSAVASFQSPELKRLISPTSTLAVSRLLVSTPAIGRLLSDVAWRLEADAVREESDEDTRALQVEELMRDEQLLDDAWQDIERVLFSDKHLRRRIKADAKRLAPQAKTSRKTIRKLLVVIIWLCVVVAPWTDGERSIEDISAPMEEVANTLLAYLAAHPDGRKNSQHKNPLRKNGPRRRRHRRKRKK
ncbi:hypothetical protein E7Z53_11570 [Kocuria salina]|uniref:hypothetical protein n=1 Tax=Kocuria salina TaxID=1929416 RepID=UPI00159398DC|nr:hypothetical protein [Kocuria salina]NVC24071.1 hypothetical protein [Kocuria salina]